jgi:DNA-binding response OmpR family regulator
MSDTDNAPYILIVDDDWTSRELLETFLTMGGYRVRQANSGETALNIALSDPPALVLLDVHMAGIDGLEVCRRLKSDDRMRAARVLMVTALESEEDRRQAVEAGADGFIAKPFEMQSILAQIQALLRRG